jgi:hypothetical protein
MSIPFDSRLRAPEDVLLSELEGESVLLNLKTEIYFGLDEVGTRMWAAVTAADSVQAAYDALKEEYDVDPERLREDLNDIVDKLVENGLLVCDK